MGKSIGRLSSVEAMSQLGQARNVRIWRDSAHPQIDWVCVGADVGMDRLGWKAAQITRCRRPSRRTRPGAPMSIIGNCAGADLRKSSARGWKTGADTRSTRWSRDHGGGGPPPRVATALNSKTPSMPAPCVHCQLGSLPLPSIAFKAIGFESLSSADYRHPCCRGNQRRHIGSLRGG